MTRALPSRPSVQGRVGVSEGATRVVSLPARAIGWTVLVLALIASLLPGPAAAGSRDSRRVPGPGHQAPPARSMRR